MWYGKINTFISRYELFFLSLTIYLYIFRTVIPLFKIFFVICVGLYLLNIFLVKKEGIRSIFLQLKPHLLSYWIIYLQIVLLIYGLLTSSNYYILIIKDIANSLILVFLLLLINLTIKSRQQLFAFHVSSVKLLILFAIVISVWLSAVLYSRFIGGDLYEYIHNKGFDYNFSLIPLLTCLIIFPLLPSKIHYGPRYILYPLLMVMFSIVVLISGSRRGLMSLVVIIICLTVVAFLRIQSSDSRSKYLTYLKVMRRYMLFLGCIIIGCIMFFITASHSTKEKSLKLIGIENTHYAKKEISQLLYRYIPKSLFSSQDAFHNALWSFDFIPEDPGSGWGVRKHNREFNLTGPGSHEIPDGVIGYKLDNETDLTIKNGNAYSFTRIGNYQVEVGDTIFVSTFCFVSPDFNGTWVRLSVEGDASSSQRALYELDEKGTWQLLSIKYVSNKKGNLVPYLYWSKQNLIDLDSLKGYVVFAYPQFKVLREGKLYDAFIKSISNSKTRGYKDYLQGYETIPNRSKYIFRQEFGLYLQSAYLLIPAKSKDNFKYYVSSTNYNSDDNVKSSSEADFGGRLSRWSYALHIFIKEYNWFKKLFGGGFDYMKSYGAKYYSDNTRADYPHNPFLSTLLYSGIFGCLFYTYLIIVAFAKYWETLRDFPFFGVIFLIAYFFTFFSSNTPFSPPLTGFFSILPYFISKFSSRAN